MIINHIQYNFTKQTKKLNCERKQKCISKIHSQATSLGTPVQGNEVQYNSSAKIIMSSFD